MDDDRFDSLTASLASSPTRRTALRVLAVLIAGLASLFGWSERHPADTKKRQRKRRHKKPADKRKGNGKGKGKNKGKGKQCSAKTKQCNGKCIDSNACCTNEECGSGGVCDAQHACVCAPEYRPCDGACIAEGDCCDDCPNGMACQEGECVCAPGYKDCGDHCILDTECCGGCPQGMICAESSCVCAPQHKTCGDVCIPNSECCGGCSNGETCDEGECVCAPEHKACGDVCIPNSECCDGCPNGMTCDEGECVCAPEHKPCDDICIPNADCCGGCQDGKTCQGGKCVGEPLYPDLRTLPVSDLEFDTRGDGTHILRFSNTVWNAGEGRLELEGDPEPPEEPNTPRKVYQNLYDAPTGGNLVSHKKVTSDLIFHPHHNHFHLANFASYLLLAWDSSTERYLPTTNEGTKTSFCIMDTDRIQSPYPKRYTTCGTDLQGLTPGWGDTYGSHLVDQWVVLETGPLSDGEYAVESTADPGGVIDEGSGNRENDNRSITYFTVQEGAIDNVREQP